MCICVFIYMLLSFANWTIFMYVHAICYMFIVVTFLIIILKNFNLLLPFWGRKDLSYWVKLLTFPAHVSVQSFIAEEENGGHTCEPSVHISNSQPVRSK